MLSNKVEPLKAKMVFSETNSQQLQRLIGLLQEKCRRHGIDLPPIVEDTRHCRAMIFGVGRMVRII